MLHVIMLNGIILNVIMLNVIMQSILMLNVAMLSVITLSVMATYEPLVALARDKYQPAGQSQGEFSTLEEVVCKACTFVV